MKMSNETPWVVAIAALVILILISLVFWQGTQQTPALALASASDTEIINEPIQPVPLHIALDQTKAVLGKKLFFEPMFSHNNTVSCASCHVLTNGGIDKLRFPVGIDSAVGSINTPTVYNSGFNFRQFWNGRAETLEKQVAGPVHNPLELGSNWEEVVGKLNNSADYKAAFGSIYPDGITPDNIADAIAVFERSLYTSNSRFDQYLRGNKDAITADELEGYTLFKTYGCVSCHQGVNVGGNMYQRMGIISDYFADRGNIVSVDYGLFNITGDEKDRYVFKVPSLRLAALTPPYFHDGAAKTLEEAVETMAFYQLGRTLSREEIDLIVKFLKTLPGENAELTATNKE